jgi:hypothetical protein
MRHRAFPNAQTDTLADARIELSGKERGSGKHPELKRQRKLWSWREESNPQPAVYNNNQETQLLHVSLRVSESGLTGYIKSKRNLTGR